MSVDVLALESLKQVFEQQGWAQDMSLKRKDLTTLLDSLGVSDANEQDSLDDISAFVAQHHQRNLASEFPLVRPADLADEDDQEVAAQSLQLV